MLISRNAGNSIYWNAIWPRFDKGETELYCTFMVIMSIDQQYHRQAFILHVAEDEASLSSVTRCLMIYVLEAYFIQVITLEVSKFLLQVPLQQRDW